MINPNRLIHDFNPPFRHSEPKTILLEPQIAYPRGYKISRSEPIVFDRCPIAFAILGKQRPDYARATE
jgi:hypothetical protein